MVDWTKTLALVVYAVGVVGGVEGVVKSSIPISVAALVVIVVGSALLSIGKRHSKGEHKPAGGAA